MSLTRPYHRAVLTKHLTAPFSMVSCSPIHTLGVFGNHLGQEAVCSRVPGMSNCHQDQVLPVHLRSSVAAPHGDHS